MFALRVFNEDEGEGENEEEEDILLDSTLESFRSKLEDMYSSPSDICTHLKDWDSSMWKETSWLEICAEENEVSSFLHLLSFRCKTFIEIVSVCKATRYSIC